jgi:hypothetical protein
MLPDIVYVVRPGETNEELRYSLRSLRNVPHRKVIIAGHVPTWVDGVVGVPVEQTGSKYQNSTNNLRAALNDPRCGPEVLLFNDDFFVLRPLPSVPLLHRGYVDDIESYYVARGKSAYLDGLRSTRAFLHDLGFERPVSYELHVPMPIQRDAMLYALEIGISSGVKVLHKRTLYGNYFNAGGGRTRDCKVLTHDGPFRRKAAFVSTMPASFAGAVGAHVRSLFPHPGRYERH